MFHAKIALDAKRALTGRVKFRVDVRRVTWFLGFRNMTLDIKSHAEDVEVNRAKDVKLKAD